MLYVLLLNAFQYCRIIPTRVRVFLEVIHFEAILTEYVEHLNKYRRPYTAGLWIGSMSVLRRYMSVSDFKLEEYY